MMLRDSSKTSWDARAEHISHILAIARSWSQKRHLAKFQANSTQRSILFAAVASICIAPGRYGTNHTPFSPGFERHDSCLALDQ